MRLSIHGFVWFIGVLLGIALNLLVLQNTPKLLSAVKQSGDYAMFVFLGGGGITMGFLLYGVSKFITEFFRELVFWLNVILRKTGQKEVFKEWATF